MKKMNILLTLTSLFVSSLSGANSNTKHEVIFDYGGGIEVSYRYRDGEKIKLPSVPQKDYHSFKYWSIDGKTYNDNENYVVTSNIRFRADYDLDYVGIMNYMSKEIVKSNVTIFNLQKGEGVSPLTALGSGGIFHLENEEYYVITNEHVIEIPSGYNDQELSVRDYLGNIYQASKVGENRYYDLGIIKFTKVIDLPLIELANKNPRINEAIFAFGQPLGQVNSITTGSVTNYRYPSQSNSIVVNFPCIMHDVPTNNGSSGCMILNSSYQLVGVHFAGSKTSEGEFIYGLSIPIEKVLEFMNPYMSVLE